MIRVSAILLGLARVLKIGPMNHELNKPDMADSS